MEGFMKVDARRRQTALYSLAAATVAAMLVVGAWWMFRSRAAFPTAMQRRINDQAVAWQCPNDHRFVAQGSVQRTACPECGRLADIAVTYVCPLHGEKRALIRLTRTPAGRERLDRVSHHRGVWDRVRHTVRCPDCGRAMSPRVEYPFGVRRMP